MYNLNFWQDAADAGLKDWSKVDLSTYAQCFTGASISQENWCKRCHLIDHVSDTCPIKPSVGNGERKQESQAFIAPAKRPALHSNPQPCRKYNTYNGEVRGCLHLPV